MRRYSADHGQDTLSTSEWAVLEKLHKFLQRFKVATKHAESTASTLEDYLPTIDYPLDTFKKELQAAQTETIRDLPYIAMLKCG